MGATTVGTGGDCGRPQLLGWGPTTYWSPNVLAVVFKKQEISQQVLILLSVTPSFHINYSSLRRHFCRYSTSQSAEATRMQDLASEFKKKFPGVIPRIITAGVAPSCTYPQSGLWLTQRPGVGTQSLVPLNFSAVVAPLRIEIGKYIANIKSRPM